ncbi:HNH endonuclease (plasmid) [Paenibacillus sp. EC2-1]|uniref:HNH endonuclease n=1 Tax=Paenibacillus sp. EC2-1 TaxID=3388665 RepID=UPI003BEF1D66
MKEQKWAEQNYTCYICAEEMYVGHPNLSIDHIIPECRGGVVLPKNISTCCKDCNVEKGSRTFDEYLRDLIAFVLYVRIRHREVCTFEGQTKDKEEKGHQTKNCTYS